MSEQYERICYRLERDKDKLLDTIAALTAELDESQIAAASAETDLESVRLLLSESQTQRDQALAEVERLREGLESCLIDESNGDDCDFHRDAIDSMRHILKEARDGE